MKKIALLIACLPVFSMTAYSNQNPRSLATDQRIKVVAYDPNNVVTLRGNEFVSSAIYFSKAEAVQNVNCGDQLAWDISVNKENPNVVFVKPKLPDSDTNMTILTNKHNYQLRLVNHKNDKQRSITYALKFAYPDEDQNELENNLQALRENVAGNTPEGSPVQWNYNYSFYGDKSIVPVQAFDNGVYTVFKFNRNTKLPAIFAVDRHQNESITNLRVQGDYVFVQGVRRQYTFRNGENVATIYNENFLVK